MWNFLLQNQKNKNDQVMRNSELKLKIYFKVFSYHNMPEVERFQQMICVLNMPLNSQICSFRVHFSKID